MSAYSTLYQIFKRELLACPFHPPVRTEGPVHRLSCHATPERRALPVVPIVTVHGIVAGVGWLTAPPDRYMGNAEFEFNGPLWSRPG
ncbi:hypothetical protein VN97_g11854 [Penicillium thymicola]|uniref:Uncharacterized protein n=1 Tax=Penicillium thymicola TaxID=293382 RepID=A0AAI9T6C7_PENTH|nr:hypothetical protein VN97_g11854 [Penicillium thymicola]